MTTLSANDRMVERVFRAMTVHKPSLAAVLSMGEEDGVGIDRRMLADQIVRNFPWPIGVELRRLFSGGMRAADRRRLDQLFRTIERSTQFLAFVMLAQVWKERKAGTVQLSPGFIGEFSRRFEQLTLGNQAWLVRELGKAMHASQGAWFMPELKEVLTDKFYASLDMWVPERNEIGHYQVNLTQEEIERRCLELGERLGDILEALAFFSRYRLVSVREIQVRKPRFKDAVFHHRIDLLNSSDSDFKASDVDGIKFTESHAVLLLRNLQAIDEYLNLSPLIIDTHSEAIDAKEKLEIRKDIFLYTKIKGDHLMYTGTEATEKCDLRALGNYSDLLEEYRDMVLAITGPAQN
ncbi:MAG TPA: hypothetical protein PLB89_10415 [Flavobacteriales bacterium]|nr:hypothetical protein [Flavobacteriales bacterium]